MVSSVRSDEGRTNDRESDSTSSCPLLSKSVSGLTVDRLFPSHLSLPSVVSGCCARESEGRGVMRWTNRFDPAFAYSTSFTSRKEKMEIQFVWGLMVAYTHPRVDANT